MKVAKFGQKTPHSHSNFVTQTGNSAIKFKTKTKHHKREKFKLIAKKSLEKLDKMSHKLNDKLKKRTLDVTESTDLRSFQDLHLGPDLTKGLNEAGFLRPSPVQWSALPMASLGVDMVVQAKSGTGKTLVFVVSALRMVKLENDCVQVILIAPTREIGTFWLNILYNFSTKHSAKISGKF